MNTALKLIASSVAGCTVAIAFAADLPPPEATEVWEPVPAIVSAPANAPPSDAVVLFDGKSASEWQAVKGGGAVAWKVADGALTVTPGSGDIRTKRSFGDVQLHLEYRLPQSKETSQGRSNSGLFFMELYELQILDSYQNKTYVNGQAGSIYKQYPPLVNASRPPGVWQTYDVIFTAPRFAQGNAVIEPARMTVFHNGVLIQNGAELRGGTVYQGPASYKAHAAQLPISLQDHGNLVAFRNIWVRPLAPRSASMR